MTGRQLAELKANIVALMQPEETVPLLLKRLGGQGRPKGPLSKGSKNKKSLHTDVHGDAGGQIGGRTQDTETKGIDTDKGNKEDVAVVRRQIEMVTDAASVLMMQVLLCWCDWCGCGLCGCGWC